MTDAERLDAAIAAIHTALVALAGIGSSENDHLIGYAEDGLNSAGDYLRTARRRCDDPDAD